MDLNIKIERLNEELIKYVDEIEKLDNYKFREICLFALTEQYANDFNRAFDKKREGNKLIFVKFIEQYCFYNIIKERDAVTAYYDYKNKLDKIDLFFQVENLMPFSEACKNINNKNISKWIETSLRGNDSNKFDHRISNLLYKYRCFLSHEYKTPTVKWEDDQDREEPFYSFFSDYTADEQNNRSYWQLNFPYEFIKKVVVSSINNYLSDCNRKQKRPFNFNQASFTWYEYTDNAKKSHYID